MVYKINANKIFNLIGLPHEILNYINEFDELTFKTLILIFSSSEPISTFDLASKLNAETVQIEKSLLTLETKQLIIITDKTPAMNKTKNRFKPTAFEINFQELKNAKNSNYALQSMFEAAEKLYARPLKPIERRTLLYIFEFLNLEVDAILMAVDFSIRNKKSLNQMLKICENWSNNGILNHEQAEQQIKILNDRKKFENKIKKCFGIYGRALSINEKNYISKWTHDYGFNINMIKLAFNKCVDATGKLSFQYIEKILNNWKQKNYKTSKEVDENSVKQSSKETISKSYNLEEMLKNSKLIIQQELQHMKRKRAL